jgi:hypothetical protein
VSGTGSSHALPTAGQVPLRLSCSICWISALRSLSFSSVYVRDCQRANSRGNIFWRYLATLSANTACVCLYIILVPCRPSLFPMKIPWRCCWIRFRKLPWEIESVASMSQRRSKGQSFPRIVCCAMWNLSENADMPRYIFAPGDASNHTNELASILDYSSLLEASGVILNGFRTGMEVHVKQRGPIFQSQPKESTQWSRWANTATALAHKCTLPFS